jgi:hypothetical protein
MLLRLVRAIVVSVARQNDGQRQSVPDAIAALKAEDPEFAARFKRALWIIQADQEIFAKYSGCAVHAFDEAAALDRLVGCAARARKGCLKESLRREVNSVIQTGRRFTDERAVRDAFRSYGLMIGIEP